MIDKKSITDEKSVETIKTDSIEQRTPINTPTDETSGAAIYYETDGTVLSASDAPDSSMPSGDTDGTDDTDAETKDGTSDSNNDATTEKTENEDGSADNGTDDADKDGDGSSDTDDDAREEASDDADTENDDADDTQDGVSSGVTGDDADDTDEGASDGDVASEAATDDESADTKATAEDDSDEDDDEDDVDIDCPTGWGPVVTKDERDYVTIKGHSFKPLTLCKVFAAMTVAPLAVSCGLSFAHMVANFELGFWHYFVAACIYGALLVACLYSIGSFVAANDRYEKALYHCVTYDELSMLIEERGINIVCFGFFAILSIIASIVVGVIMSCIF